MLRSNKTRIVKLEQARGARARRYVFYDDEEAEAKAQVFGRLSSNARSIDSATSIGRPCSLLGCDDLALARDTIQVIGDEPISLD